ncbi:MAG: MmcB family DNA repair protein [Alphaproteobacteria bacterium]|nr:MmcB family DNA repair protein [Alphaproteobacteria bacterium]
MGRGRDFAAQAPSDEEARLTPVVTRGAARGLVDLGYSVLLEFTLPSGRRVDIMGLHPDGALTAVEVKTSVADFRGDAKWPDYRAFCDQLYFAVPESFPIALIPEGCGLLIADGFGAVVNRPAEEHKLPGARRAALIRRFARAAADRLHAHLDPRLG